MGKPRYNEAERQGRREERESSMKLTDRAPVRTARRTESSPEDHRRSDILGVLLLAGALIIVLSLALRNTGILGDAAGGLFRMSFGKGAWLVPIALGVLGVSCLAGRKSFEFGRLTVGLTIMFLAFLGGIAGPVAGDYFDPTAVSATGGYVGAMMGWLFDALLGSGKLIAIGALGMVGLILTISVPISSILGSIKKKAPAVAVKRTAKPTTVAAPRKALVHVTDHAAKPLPADSEQKAKKLPVVRETPTLSTGSNEATPKEGYKLPPMNLLTAPATRAKRSAQEMQQNIETLEGTLEEFGIDANVVEVATGPTVTRYEIQLGPGIRVARITALADNIAMNLAASHVRVEAPIPGKAAIGVEVPNAQPKMVTLREVCDTPEFRDHKSRLCVALGQDVSGENKFADLTTMPHLLIGGATNSGKSIGLASVIMSLLVRNTPKDVRMVMIDPKRVELSLFDNIPHLMCPVIRDVKEAPAVLRAVWREMDRRYDKFSEAGVRNIASWNEKATFQDKMPYIVVIIDELADLMIQAAAEVETSICRLAQLARATGIHLVIATQRPSVDVITGTIKANIASRVAFTVSSQIDSRTILDQKGAEALIGKGDMLFLPIDASKPIRVQGCYVSEKEIESVCQFWRDQEGPAYIIDPAELVRGDQDESGGSRSLSDDDMDALWEDAVRYVADKGQASTSMLQRRFSIGFQRASRLLDTMEERGIVGPRDGPRPREVLVSPMDADALFGTGPRYDTGRNPYEDEPPPGEDA